MRLHRLVPDNDLAAVLLQPLVFGNRKQINALKDLEAEINLKQLQKIKIANGDLKVFDVTISYSGEQKLRVLATDEMDAKEKAKDEASDCDVDIEIDFITASEVSDNV